VACEHAPKGQDRPVQGNALSGFSQRTISAGSFDEIQQDATFCDSGQNLVGSHSGRRHPGIDGSPNHRNKSDRKENARQSQLCSMPP
jgi:hypothetical protein